jgi:DNA-binding HxlR family transcriptional regulator
MRWNELDRESCSIARTISVVGDRWTLLILRECFLRVRRFDEFQERLGITRHLLAARLRKLVKEGVLERVPYKDVRTLYEYRLTEKGLDLYPIMMSLVHWGNVHKKGKKGVPLLHKHMPCGHDFHAAMVCSECGEPVDPRQVHVHAGPGASRRGRALVKEKQRA